MRICLTVTVAFSLLALGHGTAHAVPILQLYIEGATYDPETETWVAAPPGSSGGGSFRLWALGNVDGPGGKGIIEDVRLGVSYSSEMSGVSITLSPSIAGGDGDYEGFTDPSTPVNPISTLDWGGIDGTETGKIKTSEGFWTAGDEVQDGSAPVLSDGKLLPWHGSFGDGVYWQEFLLGDFTLTDSPTADFIDQFPTELHENTGQINVYEVSVAGGSGIIHFDLYNHVGSDNRAKFAPFSHDAEIIPEPSAYIAWLLIGLTWAGSAWTYKYSSRWRELDKEVAFAGASTPHSPRPTLVSQRSGGFLRQIARPLVAHRPAKPR